MNLLADHILSVAQKNQKSLNNLKLQKVMYFVLKESRDIGKQILRGLAQFGQSTRFGSEGSQVRILQPRFLVKFVSRQKQTLGDLPEL